MFAWCSLKPRLLDLFCGAGGAAMGYSWAGFEVVGVDIEPQPNYPFEFFQDDALAYLTGAPGRYYDAIHASPPCQFASTVTPDPTHYPNFIPAIRDLLDATGLPYVIENVVGAKKWLRNPVTLCGSSFPDLHVLRHRLFECSFPVMQLECRHSGRPDRFDVYEHGRWYRTPWAKVYGSGGGKAMEHWFGAMGIDWMTHDELAQAIPPHYTEHIGGYLMAHLKQKAAA